MAGSSAANLDRETRFNGSPASAVAIYQTPGANAITTLQAVRDQVHGAVAAMPLHEDFLAQYCPAQKPPMAGTA